MTVLSLDRGTAKRLLDKRGAIVALAAFSTLCFLFDTSWVGPSLSFPVKAQVGEELVWVIQFVSSFVMLCALGAVWKRVAPPFNKVCVGLSLAIAVGVLVGRTIKNSGTLTALVHSAPMLVLDAVLIVGYALPCYAVLSMAFTWLVRATKREASDSERPCFSATVTGKIEQVFERVGLRRHPMRVSFVAVLVCWTPLFALMFPGVVGYDLAFQLVMAGGTGLPLNDHNPVVATLLFHWFVEAGRLVGSPALGLALLTVASCFSLAAIVALIVSRLVAANAPAPFVLASIALFGLLPIWQFFAVSPYKDVFFTAAIVWFCVMVWDAYGSLVRGNSVRFSTVVQVCVAIALASLFRSTAGLVVIVTLAALLVSARLRRRRVGAGAGKSVRLVVWCGLATFIVVQVTLGAVVDALGIEKHRTTEAMSIPIQQTARYMTLHPDDVTNEEQDALYRFYDREKLFSTEEYLYTPYISDPVKWTIRDDLSFDDMVAFLQAWFSMGLRDPLLYLDAFVATTYGFFDVSSTERDVVELSPPAVNVLFDSSNMSLDQWDTSSDGRRQLEGMQELGYEDFSRDVHENGSYDNIFTMMYATTSFPGFAQLQLPPCSVWALIALAAYLVWRRRSWMVLALAPGFACMFVLAISPCVHVRYALPIMLMAPLAVWLMASFAAEDARASRSTSDAGPGLDR